MRPSLANVNQVKLELAPKFPLASKHTHRHSNDCCYRKPTGSERKIRHVFLINSQLRRPLSSIYSMKHPTLHGDTATLVRQYQIMAFQGVKGGEVCSSALLGSVVAKSIDFVEEGGRPYQDTPLPPPERDL